MNLKEWADETAAPLTAAGVRCVTDPRNLTLPGALLLPKTITADRLLAGVYTVEWDLYLIAGGAGTDHALTALGTLSTLLETAGLLPPDLEATTLDLPNHSPDPMPALTGTITNDCEDTP